MKVFSVSHCGSFLMPAEDCYLLFDCPGQVELFMLHDALNKILKVMTDDWHLRWVQRLHQWEHVCVSRWP